MKAIISLLILVLSISSYSSGCYEKFVQNGSIDSRSFQIFDSHLEGEFERNPIGYAKEAILNVAEKVGCDQSELGLQDKSLDALSCKEIIPGNPNSSVCYVESAVGYFILSKDMLDGVNIIYNRWD